MGSRSILLDMGHGLYSKTPSIPRNKPYSSPLYNPSPSPVSVRSSEADEADGQEVLSCLWFTLVLATFICMWSCVLFAAAVLEVNPWTFESFGLGLLVEGRSSNAEMCVQAFCCDVSADGPCRWIEMTDSCECVVSSIWALRPAWHRRSEARAAGEYSG